MKQKKLIDTKEEENEVIPEEIIPEDFGDHYMDDFYQDYRSLKSSVDYNDEEYRHVSALNEKVFQVFHESRWCALGPNKKIPKDLIPFIFQEMFEAMKETDFNMVEKFVSICDFMNVAYAKAYELIHMKYKEDIVSEMDKKYGILSKKRIKKIF